VAIQVFDPQDSGESPMPRSRAECRIMMSESFLKKTNKQNLERVLMLSIIFSNLRDLNVFLRNDINEKTTYSQFYRFKSNLLVNGFSSTVFKVKQSLNKKPFNNVR
jgi:hypothetical protein